MWATRTVQDEPLKKGLVGRIHTKNFVPDGIFGDRVANWGAQPEPKWGEMRELPANLLLEGLRRRNWTHDKFEADAPKWSLQLWTHRGSVIPSWSWNGYRVVVHQEGVAEPFWSWLEFPGIDTGIQSYLSGGSLGTPYRFRPKHLAKREPLHPHEVGYNQLFEQLFEAHQEQLADFAWEKLEAEAPASWTVPRRRFGMDHDYAAHNPGYEKLAVTYAYTEPPKWQLSLSIPVSNVALQAFAVPAFIGFAFFASLRRSGKGMPRDLQEAQEYAYASGDARKDGVTGVTLADVAGLDAVLTQFDEVISYLQDPVSFTRNGVKPPRGLLLEGPPGIGKTLLAKAIAGEAKVGFYATSAAEFVEIIVGVGAARVRDLFRRAGAYDAPAVVFIDEIDAIGVRRAKASENADEEREQTLNQLLTELDGFSRLSNVLFIAATNRADLLDQALMRAGRFDRIVKVPRPDSKARHDILKVHARKHKFADDADLQQLANDTPGLVGADLANTLNAAAIMAVREKSPVIRADHLAEARDREIAGDRKPPVDTTSESGEAMMRRFAAYQGARALYSEWRRAHDPGCVDAVHKVSIVKRGGTFTRTVYKRGLDEEYFWRTKAQVVQEFQGVLASPAGVEVLGMEATTMHLQDFKRARELIETYAEVLCMSELGITDYYNPVEPDVQPIEGIVEIDKIYMTPRLIADAPGGLLGPVHPRGAQREADLLRIIREQYGLVKERMTTLEPALRQLADELYAEKEVTGERICEMLREHGLMVEQARTVPSAG